MPQVADYVQIDKHDGYCYVEFKSPIDGMPIRLGDLVMMEDGYYQFFPDLKRGGYWPTWMLRRIAYLVDVINDEWDECVRKDLEELAST